MGTLTAVAESEAPLHLLYEHQALRRAERTSWKGVYDHAAI